MKKLRLTRMQKKNGVRREPPPLISYCISSVQIDDMMKQIKMFLQTYYCDVCVLETLYSIPNRATYISVEGFAHFLKQNFIAAIKADENVEISFKLTGNDFVITLSYNTREINDEVRVTLDEIARESSFTYTVSESCVDVVFGTTESNACIVNAVTRGTEVFAALRVAFTESSPIIVYTDDNEEMNADFDFSKI
jgi:hypothetical protein